MFDDFFNMYSEFRVHFFSIIDILIGHVLNDCNDFGEYLRSIFFHKSHKLFDFFFLWFIDDHFITLFEESI